MDEEEQILNIPLIKTKSVPRTKRAKRAVQEVREYVMRHLKAEEDDVWIDNRLNEAIWSKGIKKPPAKLRVRAIKFEDGLVEVSLPEE
ncbi:MAG: 50S ribosomal protein L31e [Methanomassiliicoccales archaeon]